MTEKTTVSIVPAQIGWQIYTAENPKPGEKVTGVYSEIVIAWAIEITQYEDPVRGIFYKVVPLCAHGKWDRDVVILRSPEGIISEPEGVLGMTEKEVIERYNEQIDAWARHNDKYETSERPSAS